MTINIHTSYRKDGVQLTVNLHNLTKVRAGASLHHSWVAFTDETGADVVMHVDDRLAVAIQEAFDEYENWLSGQEGPTFDDALGAKCDDAARDDAARALK